MGNQSQNSKNNFVYTKSHLVYTISNFVYTKFYRAFKGAAVFSAFSLIAFAASTTFMPTSNSNAASDLSTFVDSETGYFLNTTSSGNVILDVVASPTGEVGVAKDTLTTKTNSTTGYKLYISTDSSDINGNRLYRDGDSSSGFYISPSAGTATSPIALVNNSWGYALGSAVTIPAGTAGNNTASDVTIPAYDADSNKVFSAVPIKGKENLIQSYNSSSAGGVNLDVYYGVNASTALPSGLYQSKILYTAIAEGELAASGEVSVSPSTAYTEGGETITVATGLYTTQEDVGDVTIKVGDAACTNVQRVNNGSTMVSFTCTTPEMAEGIYGVSVSIPKYGKTYTKPNAINFVLPPYMQYFTASKCSSMNVGDTLDLIDSRDRTEYTIAKLKDGNCWMVEDLKFALTEGDVLEPATTNVTANVTVTNKNPSGNPATTQATEETVTAWCTENSSACVDQFKSISYGVPNGYLYNWYTATASAGTYNTASGSVSSSICPAGWTLPVNGTSSGTYEYLLRQYGWTGVAGTGAGYTSFIRDVMLASPLNFDYTGYRLGDTTRQTVAYGAYWYRTVESENQAHNLGYNAAGDYIHPQDLTDKYYGFAIRCLAT